MAVRLSYDKKFSVFSRRVIIHTVSCIGQIDFKVDDTYFFEIGGKNKKSKQIVTLENSYIVADDIEYGFQHKIPS